MLLVICIVAVTIGEEIAHYAVFRIARDQRFGRGDPTEQTAQWGTDALQSGGMGDARGRGHAQSLAVESPLRGIELLVDGLDEVIDGQAKRRPAQHPQTDAQA